MKILTSTLFIVFTLFFNLLNAQNTKVDPFAPLPDLYSASNTYRNASGSPGHQYWQQQADYKIEITLDENKRTITGKETITYSNNSPDVLEYLWIQADQNKFKKSAFSNQATSSMDFVNFLSEEELFKVIGFNGGFNINNITDIYNKAIPFTVINTMIRLNLPEKLLPGKKLEILISWNFEINDISLSNERSGFEYFPEDKNFIFAIAQFYPRMAVYNDVEGWQNKQYLGEGEFALEFGNFEVSITVPSDHIIAATGELSNATTVLSKDQLDRFTKAKTSDKQIIIVSEEEVKSKESQPEKTSKTWKFIAKNVRDFAFASSRKFIWDAVSVNTGTKNVLAMSFYPKEGKKIWEKTSTKMVEHTIKFYSDFVFEYPYPVAQSINISHVGMEYPMISFNEGGRDEGSSFFGSYSENLLKSIIIHEVGHNWFPMIINSDERQWGWMDEGINSFVQYLAESNLDKKFPSWSGKPSDIIGYMRKNSYVMPIMTSADNLLNISEEAYFKPAVALGILRNTILGEEVFDYAFKSYAERWKFKHPYPADFFKSMEEASGADLDWFWRSWFYSTDNVDQALTDVEVFYTGKLNNDIKKSDLNIKETEEITIENSNSPHTYDFSKVNNKFWATVRVENKGNIVMPIILKIEFEDQDDQIFKFPAEIWRSNSKFIYKRILLDYQPKRFVIDPFYEIADIDQSNNTFPIQKK